MVGLGTESPTGGRDWGQFAMQLVQNFALLVGRIMIVGIFVWDGMFILKDTEATASYMVAFGLPGALWPAVMAFQFAASALIIIGWLTRLAAVAFAGFCLVTALVFHTDFAQTNQILHFGKDIGLAGGFLILAAAGPGAWSVDGARH